MWGAVELPDVHDITFVLEHRSFVVIHVKVVGGREDGHDRGEASRLCFAVHAISSILGLVSSNDRQEVVAFQELASSLVAKSPGQRWAADEKKMAHVKK